MFSPRDRFFAERVVAKGLATQAQIRASLTSSGAEDPGMLPRYLVAGRVITEDVRLQIERECDAWRRSCACGEVFYVAVPDAKCPRCSKVIPADIAHMVVELGSVGGAVSADLIAEPPTEVKEVRDHLGPYRILEELGRGGMGVVYRAIQEPIERPVALKVLLEPRGKRRERFVREARAAARLEHPNIVRVHDVGEVEGTAFFTMPLLEGKPLDRILIEKGRLPAARALEILEPIARAVHHAHEHRIIHRDLKPGNIFITKQNVPVLIDFGLARALDEDADKLTRTGVAIGTPHYMSPEQVRGVRQDIDQRTDVWALGVILHELIVGERPFKGDTASELYASIQLGDAPRLRSLAPDAPAAVEAIVAKALDRSKDNRYRTALELADDLGRARRGEVPTVLRAGERLGRAKRRAKKRLRAAAIFLVALAVMGAAFLGVRAFLAKRDRDLLAVRGAADRESVKKLAASLVIKAHARATDAGQTTDPRAARAAAEEAVAAVGSLEATLAASVSTEQGKEEARLQAATPEALAALRGALLARAQASLRGGKLDALEVAASDLARARLSARDDVELASLHADTLCRLERADEADAALGPALAAHPDDPLLLLRQGEAKLAQGAADAGLALVERAHAARADDPELKLARARARVRAGRASAALEDLRASPNDPEARLLAVEAWLALGRVADARSIVRELATKQGQDDAVALRARALVARAREDDEALRHILTKLIAKNPDDADLLAARGHARIALRDEDAASDLRAAAEHALAPRRRVALRIELAQLEDATGRGADATRDLERALAAAGTDGVAQALVHVAHARRALVGLAEPVAGVAPGAGQPDLGAAREALARAVQAAPGAPGVAATRAWLAVEERDAARALELVAAAPRDLLAVRLELAARRLPGADAAQNVAALESEVAALEVAATDPASVLERRAVRDLRTAFHAGSDAAQARVWDSAAKHAALALALAPRRATAAAVAAIGLLQTKAPEASARCLALAREWQPGSSLVQLAGGIAAFAVKDHQVAARSLGEALALSRDDLGVDLVLLGLLAEARLRASDPAGAEEAARRALELDPTNPTPLRALEKAAALRGDAAGAKAASEAFVAAVRTNPLRAREIRDQVVEDLQSLKAVAALERAVRLSPRDSVLWRDLCYARFGVSDMVGAWRAWVRALEIEPYDGRRDLEEQSYVSTTRLRQLSDGSDFERVVATLQETDARGADLHFLHAWTLWSRIETGGDEDGSLLDRAVADLDRALAGDRRFATAWALRGHLRALRGEVGPAREDLARAHEVHPERMPVVHAYLASLDAANGDVDGAVKELENAVKEGWTDRGRLAKLPGVAAIKDEPRVRALLAKLPDAPETGLSEGF